jgi:hypothetical protein
MHIIVLSHPDRPDDPHGKLEQSSSLPEIGIILEEGYQMFQRRVKRVRRSSFVSNLLKTSSSQVTAV